MSLKNRVADQMDCSSVFSFKNPWIVSFLIPIFTFVCGNFTVFVITSLILCSYAFLFFTHSKHSVSVTEEEDEFDLTIGSNLPSNVEIKGCLNVGSPDSSSESEIVDLLSCTTEEDSDFDGWHYSGELRRRVDCSDGSISDEESLIEIELFGGHHDVGFKDYKDEEEHKFCRRQGSPDSVLWWPEMNEEENMIEIDLSVGSIKCSRIEIKA